jgi:hypothetical protein
MARPTAIFHLTFLLGLLVHNFTESNLFSNGGLLAVGLLICILDLEKWRTSRSEDWLSQRLPASTQPMAAEMPGSFARR